MKKRISIIYVIVFTITLTFISNICLANPISVTPSYAETFFALFLIFAIDLIIDVLVLAVAFLILKKPSHIKSLRFLFYVFLAAVVGLIIDWLSFSAADVVSNIPVLTEAVFFVQLFSIALSSFIMLFLYNYLLSQRFFHLTKREATIVGLFVGIFTNPVFFYVYSQLS